VTFIAADESVPFAVNLLTAVQQYQKNKGRQQFEISVKHRGVVKEVYIKGHEYTETIHY